MKNPFKPRKPGREKTYRVSNVFLDADPDLVADIRKQAIKQASGLSSETQKLLELLQTGKTVHFLEARDNGISRLADRIAELRDCGLVIHNQKIRLSGTICEEYSLLPLE